MSRKITKRVEKIKSKMKDILIDKQSNDELDKEIDKINIKIGMTRYSDEELAMFKELILKKILEARETLDFYKDELNNEALILGDKISSMEEGGFSNRNEAFSQKIHRQEKFINNLENALIRIENKTYGICRLTGELIDKKRLLATPHATTSIDAKLNADKK
ncbi:MAG: TraR/DksA family transcriptional regulator [Chitinophagales bacterium]|jgi:RNA polymerase-binding transcription factor DksA|nr:TraR/DksA family transcriptional regulator [Chitinophagales bacterium]